MRQAGKAQPSQDGKEKKPEAKRCDELKTRILLMLKLQVALRLLRKGSSPLDAFPMEVDLCYRFW